MIRSSRRRVLRESFGRAGRYGALVGALALAPLGLGVAAVHAAPADTAPSPVFTSDFDDGSQGPWTANGGATLAVVPSPGGSGESLEVSDIGHDYDGAALDLTKLLTPGVAYTISFDARLADATQPPGSVHFTVDDGAYTWVSGGSALSADAWTTITGSYTLAAGATKANMYLDSSGAAPFPDVLMDNVTITGPASGGGGGSCTPSSARTLVGADFDDQALDGLQKDGGPTLGYEHVDGDGAADYSLRVEGRTDSYFGVQTAPGALSSLVPGDTVQVSAKVRLATQTDATTSARVVANDGTYAWIGNESGVSDTGWTTLTGSYTVPAGLDTSTLSFYLGTDALTDGTSSYDYDLDDVSITVPGTDCPGSGGGSNCTYPSGDTLISSDFESGDADGWVGRDDGHGTATVAVVAGGHDSDHALEASGRTSQGQGVGHDVTCLLQPGQTYQFSGWVRFAAGQPADDVWLSLANTVAGTTTYSTLGQFTGVTDGGWTQVTQKFTMPASSDSALLYLETKYYSDGSAGNTSDLLLDDLTVTEPAAPTVQDLTPIKDTLPFPVGAAVSSPELTGAPGQLLAKHFDQVTPENFMKPEAWYDAHHDFVTENTEADALMTYAQQHHMRVYGHNLVWYQQTPDWFFQDDQGNWLTDSDADKAILLKRLDDHIDDVAKYLADKYGKFGSATNPLVSFDVVNEAVSDNAGDPDDLRQSHWYQVLGESYIEDAFNEANKEFNDVYAAPSATHPIDLFYNDYNTEQAGKRGRVLELVNRLIKDGVPIDGVGHQFHVTMSTPVSSLKDAVDAFRGIQTADGHELYQAVTELDVPTGTPVTDANEIAQGYYYGDVFDMLRSEYADGAKIFSATVWGLTDSQSWRASSGAPLLFDDDLQAKPAYYGVTDQPLPAKQLSAVVFQQGSSDVDASDAGATGDIEWRKLPLIPVGDHAGFQLRWTADHLTAYVSVSDAGDDATDQATFAWGDGSSTATVSRDGTVTGAGVSAEVSSTADGWKAVVDLPTGPLTASSTPKLDVSVTNGDHTDDWNTPGSLATLQLVEPLSFTTIPEARTAPTIDGTEDAAWDGASTVTTDKLISGTAGGATATVHQLWKGDYLYVLADVTDPHVDVSSPNAYEQDSVEIFTDPGNAKNGSYRPDDAQMRISANNATSFGAGDTDAAQQARLESATSRTATGYIVEARIDLKDGNTGVGSFEGLDYEVNDGTDGARTSNSGWAEPSGTAYQTTARWGVAELVGPAAPAATAPAVTRQPRSTTVRLGRTATFTAAASGTPKPSVIWQRRLKGRSDWTTVRGAVSPTLRVTAGARVDGASYRAVFANAAGTARTSVAKLAIAKVMPSVVRFPWSVWTRPGASVRLVARATGYPAPTVSWQVWRQASRRWAPVPGGHATALRLRVTRAMNGARYRAVFANAAGAAVSTVATVHVRA